MNNSRTTWTAYLNAFNNCNAIYNANVRGWMLTSSSFAVEGIKSEGFFTVKALTGERFVAIRTNKAHQG